MEDKLVINIGWEKFQYYLLLKLILKKKSETAVRIWMRRGIGFSISLPNIWVASGGVWQLDLPPQRVWAKKSEKQGFPSAIE